MYENLVVHLSVPSILAMARLVSSSAPFRSSIASLLWGMAGKKSAMARVTAILKVMLGLWLESRCTGACASLAVNSHFQEFDCLSALRAIGRTHIRVPLQPSTKFVIVLQQTHTRRDERIPYNPAKVESPGKTSVMTRVTGPLRLTTMLKVMLGLWFGSRCTGACASLAVNSHSSGGIPLDHLAVQNFPIPIRLGNCNRQFRPSRIPWFRICVLVQPLIIFWTRAWASLMLLRIARWTTLLTARNAACWTSVTLVCSTIRRSPTFWVKTASASSRSSYRWLPANNIVDAVSVSSRLWVSLCLCSASFRASISAILAFMPWSSCSFCRLSLLSPYSASLILISSILAWLLHWFTGTRGSRAKLVDGEAGESWRGAGNSSWSWGTGELWGSGAGNAPQQSHSPTQTFSYWRGSG